MNISLVFKIHLILDAPVKPLPMFIICPPEYRLKLYILGKAATGPPIQFPPCVHSTNSPYPKIGTEYFIQSTPPFEV